MTVEMLQAVDENRRPIGIFPRTYIHEKGLLHETFHCWAIQGDEVFVQVRSPLKKDFPGMLDITAAGHLMAGETVQDGVRELEEEIGLRVSFKELTPLGVVKDEIHLDGFLDREWAHVFLVEADGKFELQKEEVEAVERIRFRDLKALWAGERIYTAEGRSVEKSDFVPHERAYMEFVFSGIASYLRSKE